MQDFTTLWLLQHILVNSVACVYCIYLAQWVTLHKIQPFYLGGCGSLIVDVWTTWLHYVAVHIFTGHPSTADEIWCWPKQVLRIEWLFKAWSKCGSLISCDTSQSSMHVYKLEDLELKICLQGFYFMKTYISQNLCCLVWIFATYQLRVALVASSWQRCLECSQTGLKEDLWTLKH